MCVCLYIYIYIIPTNFINSLKYIHTHNLNPLHQLGPSSSSSCAYIYVSRFITIHTYLTCVMDFELSFREGHNVSSIESGNNDHTATDEACILSEAWDDFCNHSESFKKLVEMGLPLNDSVEAKLAWLRSQIVGDDAEFDSPFGRRRILYSDHTASGRSLHHTENFIIHNFLPFYGTQIFITSLF